eukprot:m.263997 g.263997  ORF g.263997 m.263997 type:complete len:472 (+) comp27421_c0_seq1:90-1505(+)
MPVDPVEQPTEQSNPDTVVEGDICGDGSVLKKIQTVGHGTSFPRSGSSCTVAYTGRLTSGEVFDSNDTFEFKIGQGVIQGWSDGVATMREGEKAVFTLQPNKAYGESGSPPKIPPNAVLEFDIELKSFTNKQDISDERNKTVLKEVLKEVPKEFAKPNDLAEVCVHYQLFLEDGTEIENTRKVDGVEQPDREPRKLIVGDGDVVPGLETGFKTMHKGEVAEFDIDHTVGYGVVGNPEKGVPPSAQLRAVVEMVSFVKSKDTWGMSVEEKVVYAGELKAAGNDFFKAGNLHKALKRYSAAIELFKYENDEEKKKQTDPAVLPCYLNAAQCQLKLRKLPQAIELADKALAIEGDNVKALYRKGMASMELCEWKDSEKCFKSILEKDPQHKATLSALNKLKSAIKRQNDKEKKLYQNMFGRMAKMAEKEQPATTEAAEKSMEVEEQKPATTEATEQTMEVEEQNANTNSDSTDA